jgi:diacylglycerol kinase (ATP)
VNGDPIGLRHALRGLAAAWRSDRNLRIEALVFAAALGLAAWLGVSLLPVLLVGGLVIGLELVNSAVETTVDLVSPEPDPLAGRAKDVAAGAVAFAALLSLVVGLVHLGPPLLARLSRGS